MHTPPKQSPCPLHSKRARAAGRRNSIVPLSQVTVGTELSPRRNSKWRRPLGNTAAFRKRQHGAAFAWKRDYCVEAL